MANDRYVSPLSERYASREMQYIFSPDMKFRTWRKLWIALAETEKELGLPITDEQIAELKEHAEDINYAEAKAREKIVRHDVMSHVYAYGLQCPKAKGIIHLGATSCYVGDNTDVIIMREALRLVRRKLINVLAELAKFADDYKSLPTLGFTHFQPAQPTTVGKRATLWMQEFHLALGEVEHVLSGLKLLGSKGTTGTQASFLELFDGDLTRWTAGSHDRGKMGFDSCVPVSGQTYPRFVDTIVLNGHRDRRFRRYEDGYGYPSPAAPRKWRSLFEEPDRFKRDGLQEKSHAQRAHLLPSRYVMIDVLNPAVTAGTQWFERTLDDSANKRLSVAEGFLAIDGVLDLCLNVTDGLKVYPKVIEKRLMSELPSWRLRIL